MTRVRKSRKRTGEEIQIPFLLGKPGKKNLGKGTNMKESFDRFAARFEHPLVTGEKYAQYKKMQDTDKRLAKGSAGWYLRCHTNGGVRRKHELRPGMLVTFDVDFADEEFFQGLFDGDIMSEWKYIAHTTHSHTLLKPKMRIILPVDKPIPPDKFNLVSRILAEKFDPRRDMFDHVCFRPAQMMFFATCSLDMEDNYRFINNEGTGRSVNWEAEVDEWSEENRCNWNDFDSVKLWVNEKPIRESAAEAEDPTTKKGFVGNFCRAYNIFDLIAGKDKNEPILNDHYDLAKDSDGDNRLTWLYSTDKSSAGVPVYRDGLFLYSHHSSDPAGDELRNAYDLTRVHLFGDLDVKFDTKNTSPGGWPSAKAMKEEFGGDPIIKEAALLDRMGFMANIDEYYDDDEATQTIADEEEEEEEEEDESPKKRKRKKETKAKKSPSGKRIYECPYEAHMAVDFETKGFLDTGWMSSLDSNDTTGAIKPTVDNLAKIFLFDKRFKNAFRYNDFSQDIVTVRPVHRDKKRGISIAYDAHSEDLLGHFINDADLVMIKGILTGHKDDAGYGMNLGKDAIMDGLNAAAARNNFNPVLDLFKGWRGTWDGKKRVATLLRTIMPGLPAGDDEYYGDIMFISLAGVINRIEFPGCKFDTAMVLIGGQGKYKSTFVEELLGRPELVVKYSGDVTDTKKVAEAFRTAVIIEMDEMASQKRSDVGAFKSFMRTVKDTTRMAFDRRSSENKRRSTMWCTSNDAVMLKDTTGNRTFFPVNVGAYPIDIEKWKEIMPQVWAEVIHWYDGLLAEGANPARMPLFLKGVALEQAEKLQQAATKTAGWQEALQQVLEWSERPLTVQHMLSGDFTSVPLDGVEHNEMDDLGLPAFITYKQYTELVGRGALAHFDAWNQVCEALADLGWGDFRRTSPIKFIGVPTNRVVHPDCAGRSKQCRSIRGRGYRLIGGETQEEKTDVELAIADLI